MKKFFVKQAISIGLIVALLFSSSVISFAQQLSTENKYMETHEQIVFDDLSVSVSNGKLNVSVDGSIPFYKKTSAKREKQKYDDYVEEHPEFEEQLKTDVEKGVLDCCISYTTAPLEVVDDHLERIENTQSKGLVALVANAASSKSVKAENSYRYSLTLCTKITRAASPYSGKNKYVYTAETYGTWDNGTTLGGSKKKPCGEPDYVLQSCPNVTTDPSFKPTYNYKTNGSLNGKNGENWWKKDGGDSWIQYGVEDDPKGISQLHAFSLKQKFKAKATSKTKKINSYYVHTYKAVTFSVSVKGAAGSGGESPPVEVSLNIKPSIDDRSWQLYNCASYEF